MTEQLADKLQSLCCAETEGKFFDCVTDNIDEILRALRLAAKPDDEGVRVSSLVAAWSRYVDLFGEPPHGTEKQMRALLRLIPPSPCPPLFTEPKR